MKEENEMVEKNSINSKIQQIAAARQKRVAACMLSHPILDKMPAYRISQAE